jgi:hypothetical protein
MKRFYGIARIVREKALWLRRDSVRLTAATAIVGAALFGLYSAIAVQASRPVIDEAALADRLTETLRQQAEARRIGSIVFASPDKYCEEHTFDNTSGNVVAIDMVDCEERLTRELTMKSKAAKPAGMKDMLTSFKK